MTTRLSVLSALCELMSGMPEQRVGEFGHSGDGGVPVVGATDLVEHRIVNPPARTLPMERAGLLTPYALKTGDILMSRSGTVGRVGLVTGREEGWFGGPHVIRLRPVREADPAYLLAYLSASFAQDWIRRAASGSTGVRHVTLKVLGGLPVRVPPWEEQQRVGRALAALDDKIRAHQEVIRATAELRAALVERMTAP
ncbi:restriction endonuclease subunit S [Streptomyces laurentii]|uniref:restriction endonuclease subunit S n=1 Tax=Streptomyces laurentii TaxID=39478 RepID=UPI0036BF8A30